MPFFYQAEKFATACRALMLPHSEGEAASVSNAFHECSLGLHQLPHNQLSDNAKRWISALENFMDTTTTYDPEKRGAWLVKAEKFSTDEKIQISQLIADLASWFDDFDRN